MTQCHMGSCELEKSWLKFQPSSQTKRDFVLKSGIRRLWLLLELDYVLMKWVLISTGSCSEIGPVLKSDFKLWQVKITSWSNTHGRVISKNLDNFVKLKKSMHFSSEVTITGLYSILVKIFRIFFYSKYVKSRIFFFFGDFIDWFSFGVLVFRCCRLFLHLQQMVATLVAIWLQNRLKELYFRLSCSSACDTFLDRDQTHIPWQAASSPLSTRKPVKSSLKWIHLFLMFSAGWEKNSESENLSVFPI